MAATHMGAFKHMGGVQTWQHQNIQGASKHTGRCPNIWGHSNIQGYIQICGHPNIQQVHPNIWGH